VTICPVPKLERIELLERGEIKSRLARAIVSNLPSQVADRELKVISEKLGWSRDSLQIEEIPSNGPGNVILIEIESSEITEVFTGFGERGVQAESVAESVVSGVREYLATSVPVGQHLADQLLIPIALAGTGAFKTFAPSRHTQTNIEVISKFLPIRFKIEKQEQACLTFAPSRHTQTNIEVISKFLSVRFKTENQEHSSLISV
jgi:RNA 3'-terminal phosphate cyclase (ATP)